MLSKLKLYNHNINICIKKTQNSTPVAIKSLVHYFGSIDAALKREFDSVYKPDSELQKELSSSLTPAIILTDIKTNPGQCVCALCFDRRRSAA